MHNAFLDFSSYIWVTLFTFTEPCDHSEAADRIHHGTQPVLGSQELGSAGPQREGYQAVVTSSASSSPNNNPLLILNTFKPY